MEEDKISPDTSDKRKVDDDNVNPKPNPKRIKLVRPVFTPVAKPTVSQAEIIKPDTLPIEVSKSSHVSDQVLNVIEKPNEQIAEITKTPIDPIEIVKKVLPLPIVPEEQVDNSSDALDIQNIFSEETKKELEHLKKNIFKIEDDGSSSENDSQPKRPRLKRPTFVKSAIENKVEISDTKLLDKTNEIVKLDSVKSVSEENVNNIGNVLDQQIVAEDNVDKVVKNIISHALVNDVDHNSILTEDESYASEVDNLLEAKSTIVENTIKVVENKLDIPENIEKIIENKTTTEENVHKLTNNFIESKNDNLKINQNTIQFEVLKQENINNKEMPHKLVEKKSIDTDKINQIAIEKNIKSEPIDENKVFKTEIKDTAVKNDGEKMYFKENVRVVLERYIDNKCNNKSQNKINSSKLRPENNKNIVETNNEKSIMQDSVTRTNEENNIENEIEYSNIDQTDSTQVGKMVETIEDNKVNVLENENKIFIINTQKDLDILSKQTSSMNAKQNNEEHESQIFKSDILKAALMSRKSPDSLVNSSEGIDQFDTNPTSLETQKTDVLPTIGQEDIVNKIEAEIKLNTKDKPTNIKKSQNKILTNMPEANISKETLMSICLNDNIAAVKHDDPPKWGSAKMNEVEKFLNDSNVTITPICKSQETPKLGKITLKLPKVGNPEIKETTVRPDVKSELIKKITNKQIAMGDSPLKNALAQSSKSFGDFATIRPAPKPSAEQIALLEQQILNTPKKRGRPSKALAQQKQLLLQYQQLQQQKVQEGSAEDEAVFHVPLFDMEDMSGGAGMFESFDASTPKRGKGIRGKGSRGRRGRGGGRGRGREGSDSDTTSNSRRMDDEIEPYPEEMNQDEETKQVAMIEAERLRKEEERERKMEARKKKLKERNDALKEKKLKKKQKAEERRLQWHEKKRLMQEEKARAAEMKKSLPPPQNFDDETRMSADCNNSRSQTPARNFLIGEDDLSMSGTTNDSMRLKKGRMEVIDLESNKTLTVDQIAEYQWPLEGGELYMIQEQISNFLGVKSFKRKYPGLKRRNVEAEERSFLCDSGLVAESLCDLGLTVLYSSEVLDIMYTDFPEKYEELREYMRLKHAKELTNRQRALMTISSNTDGSKLDLRERAMEAAANWNANLNKSRLEFRKCSMDMQTFIVHYPKTKCKKMAIPKNKIGSYPLALLPGQFCDYHATYSSEDLRYLPMNTVMYGPLKSVDKDFPVSLSSQSESEDSSSDDSSDSDDSIDVDNKLEKNELEFGPSDKKGAECKLCLGTAEKNKKGTVEPLIHCSKCLTIYHPTCLDMTLEMVPYIKRYNWQCNECKSCAQCKEVADEDKMLFCDLCDRGYHIYCVGLRRVPEGRWHCQECAMCNSCGVSDPGPGDSKWFYEFKKIEKTGAKVYCRTLCAPCSRMYQ
ncbi:uncharacterized protein LOC112689436 isoform X2 [Sipha flava]|uniref:PHD finger protein 10 n=1 Tax=Sipha flava TaxID=143950 RepID=A0A8B8G7V7_9HEMI|nr:uncharacterized protein LOC112689436 isoform X2 [Sipha flava]